MFTLKKNCYVWNLDGGFYYKVKIWGCIKLIFQASNASIPKFNLHRENTIIQNLVVITFHTSPLLFILTQHKIVGLLSPPQLSHTNILLAENDPHLL